MDKERIKAYLFHSVQSRKNNLTEAIAQAQESMLLETKSSSGDKHETARAKMQIELEKLSSQLNELEHQILYLNKINFEILPSVVQPGAIVKTDKGDFVVALGIGKIESESFKIYGISTSSPIGQQMIGKKIGDTFTINGIAYTIKNIG